MSETILTLAAEVRKDRAARVDDPEGNFARIAKIWEVVFGHPVTTRQVALAMIGLKLARECYKPWQDNLVDLCGYADCLAEIEGYYAPTEQTPSPSVAPTPDGPGRPDAEAAAKVDGEGNRYWVIESGRRYGLLLTDLNPDAGP